MPTDPTGGAAVSLSDDSYRQVTLSGTNTVAVYGQRTNVFFIGSNGYLTLNSGDTTYAESFASHFNQPRVSALFDDLYPNAGSVSWKQMSNRVVVTYQNVPEYGTSDSNTFQIELFFDGRIRLTYLLVEALGGLVGLSAGQDIPAGFIASDFTSYGCGPQPPQIARQPASLVVADGGTANFSVVATGTAPLSYFWLRNGTLITGATATSYALTNVQFIDAGSQFSCLVSNVAGVTSSGAALLTVVVPAANDQCVGAIAIAGDSYTNTQNTLYATSVGDPQPDCVAGFGNGVWYSFTAPCNGLLRVDTIDSDFDTGLALYAGTCGSLSLVVCDDDRGGGGASWLTNTVAAGATYHILAGGHNGASGNLVLHLAFRPGPITLSQGDLTVALDRTGGYIQSMQFQGIELYHVGACVSDWGLQTGTDPATFVRNENDTGTIGQPMILTASNATAAVYAGVYAAGGANVALSRSYALVPGSDLLRVVEAFTNNGAASLTLRCFDTYNPDWNFNGASSFSMAADRYVMPAADGFIMVGRGILNLGQTSLLLGTADSKAIVAACSTNYFGIRSPADLNGFFATTGADSGGAVVDATLDIGREFILAPGGTALFVFYQSVATNAAFAETALQTIDSANQPPGIVTQPFSQTNNAGATTVFAVEAVGAGPLGYQWRIHGTRLNDGGNISGSRTPTLTLGNVSGGNAGSYSVVVSNALGAVTSHTALLTVLDPVILVSPSNQVATLGDTVVFSVTAAGVPPLSYQWRHNGTELGWGGFATLTVSNAQTADAGCYDVVVSDAFGSAVSQAATLTLLGAPVIASQPTNLTVLAGTTATFAVSGTGARPMGCFWLRNGVAIPGATTSSYSLSNAQMSDSGSQFSCLLSNAFGTDTSRAAILTVTTNLHIRVAIFAAEGTTSWDLDPKTKIVGTGLFTNADVDVFDVQTGLNPTLSQLQQYAAVLTWSDGAYSDSSGLGNVLADYVDWGGGVVVGAYAWGVSGNGLAGRIVSYLPFTQWSVAADTAHLTLLKDLPTHPLLDGVSSFDGATYSRRHVITLTSGATQVAHWSDGLPLIAYKSQVNGAVVGLNFRPTSTDVNTYGWQSGTDGGRIMANALLWAARASQQPPVIVTQPQSQTNNATSTASFSAAAAGACPFNYQWFKNGASVSNAGNVSGATTPTLTLSKVLGGDAGGYSVTVSNALGNVASLTANLTVLDPSILLSPSSQTANPGDTVMFAVRAVGTPPFSYQWRHSGTNVAWASGASMTLTNARPADAGSYDAVVSGAFGSVTSQVATLTLLGAPVITLQPAGQAVLPGTTASFSLSATGASPLSYFWLRNGALIAGATGMICTITNVQLSDSGSLFSCLVSNAFGTVTSASAALTVMTNHLVAVFVDPAFVDITSGGVNAEAINVQSSLTSLGQLVTTFTNIIAATVTNNILLFPEQENASLAPSMSSATAAALSNFVAQGGLMIVHGSGSGAGTLLNKVFGFGVLESAEIYSSGPTYGLTGQAAGTAFGGGPASLPCNNGSITLTGLPTGATSLYASNGLSVAALMPVGLGNVVFLGWDWYNAAPIGSQNGGWLSVLATAVGLGGSSTPRAPFINIQPASVATNPGATVTFGVAAFGTPPLSYFWFRNGLLIAGPTGSIYTTNEVQLADSGSQFSCLVSNAYGTATSSNATLTVVPRPLDHFTWDPIASPQAVNAPFSVGLTARDAINGTVNNFFGPVALSAAGLSGTVLYGNNFEDGTLNGWLAGTGVYTRQVTAATAAGGTHSLTLIGGAATHFDGVSHSFAGVTPDQIRFYVRAASSSLSSAYFVAGQGPITDLDAVFFYMRDDGTMGLYDGATWHSTPYVANQWYKISFSLNWSARTVAYFVNDTLVAGGVPFRGPSVSSLTTVNLYNYDYGQSWYDEIAFLNGSTNAYPLTPTVSGNFTNGAWTGSVAVLQDATNVVLTANDGAGHAGSSAPFIVDPTPTAPAITAQPASVLANVGGTASYNVTAAGAAPLGYFWLRNGVLIDGATNSTYVTNNVQLSDSGSQFSCLVSNSLGTATSSPALLRVLPRPMDHFSWDVIGSPQAVGVPFAVTLTARDAVNGPVTNFSGTAALTAASGGVVTNTILNGLARTNSYTGNSYTDGYAFTPNTNLMVTHLRYYEGTKVSIWTDAGTLVASQNVTSSPGTWSETPLTTPVTLLGGVKYRIGVFYPPGATYYVLTNFPNVFSNGVINGGYYATGDGFPTVIWSAIAPVDIRYTVGSSTTNVISPVVSGTFVNGVWSGSITAQQTATNLVLTAADGPSHSGASNPFNVIQLPTAPSIVVQPVSISTNAGATVSFNVAATGTAPLIYSWLWNGTPLLEGTNIVGSRSPILTLNTVGWADAGGYSVIISNSLGCVTSVVATLTVPEISITGQPVRQTVHPGQSVSLSVSADGAAPLSYQWRFNGLPLDGATTASLTLTNVQFQNAGGYDVAVTGLHGAITSAVATIDLYPALDPANPGADETVYALVPQSDGKVLVGGAFSTLGGQPRANLGRLNLDGTLDTSFNAIADSVVSAFAVQPTGQIVLGGGFANLNGQPRSALGRLNADGSLDSAFSAGVAGHVYCLAAQADGKILVGGQFTQLAGRSQNHLGRLNPDGTPDTAFAPAVTGTIFSLAIQADGKILVGGNLSSLGGVAGNRVARLQPDGTLDTAFSAPVNNGVLALAALVDGKIVVGGQFTSLGGGVHNYLGRLNADGTLDAGFNASADSVVKTLAIQADGKLLVGGNFSALQGRTCYYLGRLQADGTFDPSFVAPANNWVYSLVLQADGSILAGGSFTTMLGQPRGHLARLQNSGPASQSLAFDGANVVWRRGGAAPEVWRVCFDAWTNGGDWINLGAPARTAGGWQLGGLSLPATATIRAHGFVAGGYLAASSWMIESYLAPPSTNAPFLGLQAGGGLPRLGLVGDLGRPYAIEFAPSLMTTNPWQPLTSFLLTNSPQFYWDASASGVTQRFYCARLNQ